MKQLALFQQNKSTTMHSKSDNEFEGFTGFSSTDSRTSFLDAALSKVHIFEKEEEEQELQKKILSIDGFTCSDCNLTLSSVAHCHIHKIFCGNPSLFVPGKTELRPEHEVLLREPASGMLSCPWCPVLSCSMGALQKHLSSCREALQRKKYSSIEKELTCPECFAKYNDMQILLHHLQTHYLGDILCRPCRKSFTSKASLVQHLLKCESIKMYRCSDCSRSFRNSKSLRIHIPNCNVSLPCLKCGQGTLKRDTCLEHMEKHLKQEWLDLGFEMTDDCLRKVISPNWQVTPPLPTHYLPSMLKTTKSSSKKRKSYGFKSCDDQNTQSATADSFESARIEETLLNLTTPVTDDEICVIENDIAEGTFGKHAKLDFHDSTKRKSRKCADSRQHLAQKKHTPNCERKLSDIASDLFTPADNVTTLDDTGDGLHLTVVNVEGAANLFDWDECEHMSEGCVERNEDNDFLEVLDNVTVEVPESDDGCDIVELGDMSSSVGAEKRSDDILEVLEVRKSLKRSEKKEWCDFKLDKFLDIKNICQFKEKPRKNKKNQIDLNREVIENKRNEDKVSEELVKKHPTITAKGTHIDQDFSLSKIKTKCIQKVKTKKSQVFKSKATVESKPEQETIRPSASPAKASKKTFFPLVEHTYAVKEGCIPIKRKYVSKPHGGKANKIKSGEDGHKSTCEAVEISESERKRGKRESMQKKMLANPALKALCNSKSLKNICVTGESLSSKCVSDLFLDCDKSQEKGGDVLPDLQNSFISNSSTLQDDHQSDRNPFKLSCSASAMDSSFSQLLSDHKQEGQPLVENKELGQKPVGSCGLGQTCPDKYNKETSSDTKHQNLLPAVFGNASPLIRKGCELVMQSCETGTSKLKKTEASVLSVSSGSKALKKSLGFDAHRKNKDSLFSLSSAQKVSRGILKHSLSLFDSWQSIVQKPAPQMQSNNISSNENGAAVSSFTGKIVSMKPSSDTPPLKVLKITNGARNWVNEIPMVFSPTELPLNVLPKQTNNVPVTGSSVRPVNFVKIMCVSAKEPSPESIQSAVLQASCFVNIDKSNKISIPEQTKSNGSQEKCKIDIADPLFYASPNTEQLKVNSRNYETNMHSVEYQSAGNEQIKCIGGHSSDAVEAIIALSCETSRTIREKSLSLNEAPTQDISIFGECDRLQKVNHKTGGGNSIEEEIKLGSEPIKTPIDTECVLFQSKPDFRVVAENKVDRAFFTEVVEDQSDEILRKNEIKACEVPSCAVEKLKKGAQLNEEWKCVTQDDNDDCSKRITSNEVIENLMQLKSNCQHLEEQSEDIHIMTTENCQSSASNGNEGHGRKEQKERTGKNCSQAQNHTFNCDSFTSPIKLRELEANDMPKDLCTLSTENQSNFKAVQKKKSNDSVYNNLHKTMQSSGQYNVNLMSSSARTDDDDLFSGIDASSQLTHPVPGKTSSPAFNEEMKSEEDHKNMMVISPGTNNVDPVQRSQLAGRSLIEPKAVKNTKKLGISENISYFSIAPTLCAHSAAGEAEASDQPSELNEKKTAVIMSCSLPEVVSHNSGSSPPLHLQTSEETQPLKSGEKNYNLENDVVLNSANSQKDFGKQSLCNNIQLFYHPNQNIASVTSFSEIEDKKQETEDFVFRTVDKQVDIMSNNNDDLVEDFQADATKLIQHTTDNRGGFNEAVEGTTWKRLSFDGKNIPSANDSSIQHFSSMSRKVTQTLVWKDTVGQETGESETLASTSFCKDNEVGPCNSSALAQRFQVNADKPPTMEARGVRDRLEVTMSSGLCNQDNTNISTNKNFLTQPLQQTFNNSMQHLAVNKTFSTDCTVLVSPSAGNNSNISCEYTLVQQPQPAVDNYTQIIALENEDHQGGKRGDEEKSGSSGSIATSRHRDTNAVMVISGEPGCYFESSSKSGSGNKDVDLQSSHGSLHLDTLAFDGSMIVDAKMKTNAKQMGTVAAPISKCLPVLKNQQDINIFIGDSLNENSAVLSQMTSSATAKTSSKQDTLHSMNHNPKYLVWEDRVIRNSVHDCQEASVLELLNSCKKVLASARVDSPKLMQEQGICGSGCISDHGENCEVIQDRCLSTVTCVEDREMSGVIEQYINLPVEKSCQESIDSYSMKENLSALLNHAPTAALHVSHDKEVIISANDQGRNLSARFYEHCASVDVSASAASGIPCNRNLKLDSHAPCEDICCSKSTAQSNGNSTDVSKVIDQSRELFLEEKCITNRNLQQVHNSKQNFLQKLPKDELQKSVSLTTKRNVLPIKAESCIFRKLMLQINTLIRTRQGRSGVRKMGRKSPLLCCHCALGYTRTKDTFPVCVHTIWSDKILKKWKDNGPNQSIYCPPTLSPCVPTNLLEGKVSNKPTKRKGFLCSNCNLLFVKFPEFKKHRILLHGETDESICHICHKKFDNSQKIAVHYAKAHPVSQDQLVPVTGHSVNPKKQKARIASISKPDCSGSAQLAVKEQVENLKYKCDKCCKTFRTRAKLKRHKVSEHKNSKLFTCPFCAHSFNCKRTVNVLIFNFHVQDCMERKDTYKAENHFKSPENHVKSSRTFICFICGKKLHSQVALCTHLFKKHREENNKGKNGISKQKSKARKSVKAATQIVERKDGDGSSARFDQPKPFFNIKGVNVKNDELQETGNVKAPHHCSNMERRRPLRNHFDSVSKSVPCEICGETFMSDASLSRHSVRSHNTPTHMCSLCGKRFIHIGALHVHMERKHNKVVKSSSNATLPTKNSGSLVDGSNSQPTCHLNDSKNEPIPSQPTPSFETSIVMNCFKRKKNLLLENDSECMDRKKTSRECESPKLDLCKAANLNANVECKLCRLAFENKRDMSAHICKSVQEMIESSDTACSCVLPSEIKNDNQSGLKERQHNDVMVANVSLGAQGRVENFSSGKIGDKDLPAPINNVDLTQSCGVKTYDCLDYNLSFKGVPCLKQQNNKAPNKYQECNCSSCLESNVEHHHKSFVNEKQDVMCAKDKSFTIKNEEDSSDVAACSELDKSKDKAKDVPIANCAAGLGKGTAGQDVKWKQKVAPDQKSEKPFFCKLEENVESQSACSPFINMEVKPVPIPSTVQSKEPFLKPSLTELVTLTSYFDFYHSPMVLQPISNGNMQSNSVCENVYSLNIANSSFDYLLGSMDRGDKAYVEDLGGSGIVHCSVCGVCFSSVCHLQEHYAHHHFSNHHGDGYFM